MPVQSAAAAYFKKLAKAILPTSIHLSAVLFEQCFQLLGFASGKTGAAQVSAVHIQAAVVRPGFNTDWTWGTGALFYLLMGTKFWKINIPKSQFLSKRLTQR